MKKLIYKGMGLALCLSAAFWTGCDKPNELDPDNSGGSSGGGSTEVVRGGIEGVVKDQTADTVIPQALVELLPTDKKTRTDVKGSFEFPDLKSGTYQLRVSKEGYETYTGSELSVTNGRTLVLSVALSPKENSEPDPGTDPEPGPVGEGYEETAFGMKLQMVAVEGGTFSMGATSEQGSDAYDFEKPVHSVTLDGFYIGAFEVTQAQWAAVMGTTIEQQREKAWGEYAPLCGEGDKYPMYYVSWEEAQSFCEKLSQKTGKTYRLPTEAEWEYAARGGNKSDGTKYAGSNTIDDVAWFGYYDETTHPVGQKKPNGLGIYDMSGNVWEWCQDWWDSEYYSSSPSVNPQGPSSGSGRVVRGGSWFNGAQGCRVSNRYICTPDYRSSNLGFRVVCER
ncbi:MAG: SUMF1/EgtB/PvdO family nonheme iron enzyme [Bacteroidales bacterium]|nr:SUMF1/EgtB/PvdO family nonheme iron enzyme [Bacteroidales bacterium]